RGESAGVVRWHEEPVGAVSHQLGRTAQVARYHRDAAGEGLEHDHRLVLVPPGRKHEGDGLSEEGVHAVAVEAAQETDSVATDPRRQTFETRPVRPLAGDVELYGREPLDGVDQGVDALLGGEASGENDGAPGLTPPCRHGRDEAWTPAQATGEDARC